MDEKEFDSECLQTDRAERLTVTAEKSVFVENWQDLQSLLDNSDETEPVYEDGKSNSEEMIIENNQNVENCTVAAAGLMHSDPSYISYCAENSSFSSDNAVQILSPSAASGNESIAIECMEATAEQDTSSFIVVDSPEKVITNTAEKNDLPLVSDNQYDHVTSVLSSSTEPSDVSGLQTSEVEGNSLMSKDYSEEFTEVTELSAADSSQPELIKG